ncbi:MULTISPECIES: hypothetical protein [Methylomicrobium]|uniref:Uncharacterized protein n=1 Tax=Methylomicrobium album BG8 TaxID=686340 RepID=H8GG04_METAL|nr:MULTISPECIES: hypothetical protein [Methylomicrobium]EIC28755.1 hypothetical protein Metal_0935 [Methylomicrobium album BG8]
MKLPIRISRLTLYGLTVSGSLYLYSLNGYLNTLHSELPVLAEWEMTLPWSIRVMTSQAFIWVAPAIPLLGAIAAWKLTNNAKLYFSVLLGSLLAMIILVFFIFLNEPLEGHLVCC